MWRNCHLYDFTFSALLFCVGSSRTSKPIIGEQQLQSWKLLQNFRDLLHDTDPTSIASKSSRKGGPKRLLLEEDYLCSFLFAQFNPVIDSMRGLCACSHFKKVQDIVCRRSMSLGSFSEAQAVFGIERLVGIFETLASENIHRSQSRANIPPHLLKALRLVDSSIFSALPRMAWAHWRNHYSTEQSAIRLHLKFQLLDEKPAGALISPAKLCERKALEMMIQPGEFYVGDRYYGRDYRFLGRLQEAECSFVMRLYEQASMKVERDLPLTEADRKAGVVSDQIVRLGARKRWHLNAMRVIRIEKPELDEPILLVTNHTDPGELSAKLLANIYQQRWEIELFFRWLKCIFGRPKQWHWFAESADGVGIQLYCALIASLLLARRLGKLPNKRMVEALRWHQMGMIDEDELTRALGKKSM
jgi:hypothetical protein